MSGYREHSFDPNAGATDRGAPMRPFNWVQWTGVALLVVSGLMFTAYLLGRVGLIPKLVVDGMPFVSLMPVGALLMNARRYPDAAPELASARRRWLLIIVAICAAVIGAAVAIEFSGA